MSSIKADAIKPSMQSNNLIFKTGSDVERMRIAPSGNIDISSNSNLTLGVTGTANITGNLAVAGTATISTTSSTNAAISGTVSGNLAISGKATSSSTSTSDTSTTLTTKSYVDSKGIVLFDNAYNDVVNVTLGSAYANNRQTLELAGYIPESANYVILTIHGFAMGNIAYNIWFGNSTSLNTGHRTHYQTDLGGGDATTNSVQAIIPINKISSSSRQVYWNISPSSQYGDTLFVDIAGYVV